MQRKENLYVMTEMVIVAIISLIGSYFAQRKTTALVVYRLEQLEKKVEKHNTFDTRMKEVEKGQALHEEKLKVINHRLDDLEKGA